MSNLIFNNIQILRAFAATNVVVMHAIGGSVLYGPTAPQFLFLTGWGASGVDLFFVISGFVMWYSQKPVKNISEMLQFMTLRCIRIVPSYWLFTGVMAFLVLGFPFLFIEMQFSIGWLIDSLLFVSQALLHQPPLLIVGWTIEYEIVFYLIFGFSLLIGRSWRQFLFVGLVLMGGVYLLGADLVVLEFLFGMAIAWFVQRNVIPRFIAWAVGITGLILLFASIGQYGVDEMRCWVWRYLKINNRKAN